LVVVLFAASLGLVVTLSVEEQCACSRDWMDCSRRLTAVLVNRPAYAVEVGPCDRGLRWLETLLAANRLRDIVAKLGK